MSLAPFKHISVENQQIISDKLYDYVLRYTNILNNEWSWNTLKKDHVLKFVPEMITECKKIIDADITMVAIVFARPKRTVGIHIDSGNSERFRLLWPIRNCTGSYTKFFDLNGNEIIEKIGKEGDKFFTIGDKFPLIEIGAAELTTPIVFDSRIPHGVFTNPMCLGARLTATIGFAKDLRYLLE